VFYDKLARRAVVCGLENIIVWNLKKNEIVCFVRCFFHRFIRSFRFFSTMQEFVLSEPDLETKPKAVIIALHPSGKTMAAGYSFRIRSHFLC
jgi:hypothetical protein